MVDKYSNLEETLPQLQRVLRQSIQSEFLEIQKLDTACMKFKTVLEKKPELEKGVYVVFSRFIKKDEHKYETFVFLDDQGKTVANVSGRELELFGIMEPCINLNISEEFEEQNKT
ncbi:MAG: hypothetical protein DRG24_03260 [Epsilonproteobacteria bacterium]|nr:MAG: hypothetical protein DRG24_03260 [Campylobacterota bacterium]